MSDSAKVTSIDAIRAFRASLANFEEELRDILSVLQLELQKAVDWIEQDRTTYWPAAARQASDQMVQARNDLERCELAIRAEDRKSCLVEKKALQKAKARLRFTEAQIKVVRQWRILINQESSEFQGQMCKMLNFIDADIPRALAMLDRALRALDQYAYGVEQGSLDNAPAELAEQPPALETQEEES